MQYFVQWNPATGAPIRPGAEDVSSDSDTDLKLQIGYDAFALAVAVAIDEARTSNWSRIRDQFGQTVCVLTVFQGTLNAVEGDSAPSVLQTTLRNGAAERGLGLKFIAAQRTLAASSSGGWSVPGV